MAAKHPFERALMKALRDGALLIPGERVLVAASGGGDSTALLLALAALRSELGLILEVVTIDHQLRPESGAELTFVEGLCGSLDVPFHGLQCPPIVAPGDSLEERARQARYDALVLVSERRGAQAVVTAHHADDQAETVLWRLIMGAGFESVAGMAATRALCPGGPRLVRPLLGERRAALLSYLEARGVEACHDASNDDLAFLRGRLRHELLPALRAVNPRVDEALVARAREQRGLLELLTPRVDALFAAADLNVVAEGSAAFTLDADVLAAAPAPLRRLALRQALRQRGLQGVKEASLRAVDELLRRRARGPVWIAGGFEVRHGGCGRLVFEPARAQPPLAESDAPRPRALVEGAVTRFDGSRYRMRRFTRDRDGPLQPTAAAAGFRKAWLDGKLLRRDLFVRRRQPGDRIRPLGLRVGSQPIKKLLQARKVPRVVRASLPVVLCGEGLVWVVGVEIDERYKLTAESREVLELTVEEPRAEERCDGVDERAE